VWSVIGRGASLLNVVALHETAVRNETAISMPSS
jgi:hypothetical protein